MWLVTSCLPWNNQTYHQQQHPRRRIASFSDYQGSPSTSISTSTSHSISTPTSTLTSSDPLAPFDHTNDSDLRPPQDLTTIYEVRGEGEEEEKKERNVKKKKEKNKKKKKGKSNTRHWWNRIKGGKASPPPRKESTAKRLSFEEGDKGSSSAMEMSSTEKEGTVLSNVQSPSQNQPPTTHTKTSSFEHKKTTPTTANAGVTTITTVDTADASAVATAESTTEQIQYIADRLGIPVELFRAVQSTPRCNKPKPKVLLTRNGKVVKRRSRKTDNDNDTNKMIEETSQPGRPRPGSLAAALGMIIVDDDDDNNDDDRSRSLHATKDARYDPTCAEADAFAEKIRNRMKGITMSKMHQTTRSSVRSLSQPGSLAAALGREVDPSATAPAVHQAQAVRSNIPPMVQPGSIAASLGMRTTAVNTKSSSSSSANVASHEPPRAGSLAEALGMRIEGTDKRFQGAIAAMDDESSHSSNGNSSNDNTSAEPAMEDDESSCSNSNGSSCTHSSSSSSQYDDSESESSEDSSLGFVGEPLQTKAGSLASLRGINLEPISLDSQPTPQATSHNGKNLFDAVIFSNVVPKKTSLNAAKESTASRTHQPQAGSLAAALCTTKTERSRDAHASPRGVANFVDSNSNLNSSERSDFGTLPPAPSNNNHAYRTDGPSSETFPVAPTSDTEIMLVVELAATKAELAGARAYGKALEQQKAQMSQSFATQLAELQQRINLYEKRKLHQGFRPNENC